MKILISEATEDQLRTFAETVLQVETTGCDTREKLVAVITPAWPDDEIELEDSDDGSAQAASPVVTPRKVFRTGRDDGPDTIVRILQTDMIGGKHPACPSVNGRKLVIQRGMVVAIPYAFYLCLTNAVQGSVTQEQREDGRPGRLVRTDVSNYPMADVVLPSQQEIAAWHARNGKRELAPGTVSQANPQQHDALAA